MEEMTNHLLKLLRDKLRTSEPTHGITEPSPVPCKSNSVF